MYFKKFCSTYAKDKKKNIISPPFLESIPPSWASCLLEFTSGATAQAFRQVWPSYLLPAVSSSSCRGKGDVVEKVHTPASSKTLGDLIVGIQSPSLFPSRALSIQFSFFLKKIKY